MFGAEDFRGDFEAGHAVGFEIEGGFEVAGGEGVVVDGLVEAGEGVGVSADEADGFHVLFGLHVGGAAEHHVLEHVGEALAVGLLVLAADVVEDADMDDGGTGQGGIDDAQSVFEDFLFEGDGLGGAGEGGEEGEEDEAGERTAEEGKH